MIINSKPSAISYTRSNTSKQTAFNGIVRFPQGANEFNEIGQRLFLDAHINPFSANFGTNFNQAIIRILNFTRNRLPQHLDSLISITETKKRVYSLKHVIESTKKPGTELSPKSFTIDLSAKKTKNEYDEMLNAFETTFGNKAVQERMDTAILDENKLNR